MCWFIVERRNGGVILRSFFFPQAPTSQCFPEADTCAPPPGRAAAGWSLLGRGSTTVTQTLQIP